MQFGLHIPIHKNFKDSGLNTIAHLSKSAQWAEGLDFKYISVLDHISPFDKVGSPESPILDCWTLLGALAMITSNTQLMPLVSNASLRHPSMIAKSAASLDVISNGRMQLGIGAGGYKPEYLQHGFIYPNKSHRYAILNEAIQIIQQLWSGPNQNFKGVHHTLSNATIAPRPLSQPLITVGGNSKEILDIAAARADAVNMVMPNESKLPEIYAYIDKLAVLYQKEPIQITTLERVLLAKNESELSSKLNTLLPRVSDLSRGLVGSVDTVIQKITNMENYGVNVIYVFFDETDLESYYLFETEIMPEFRH